MLNGVKTTNCKSTFFIALSAFCSQLVDYARFFVCCGA
ncbi:MAG: hypothetical protein OFPII_30090 [Osedax symbiont Rs1]|nr:MAG: hypothetical protein OFPII_30090 [Osedax symbiont Rs1]